jgi:hypothetical protein
MAIEDLSESNYIQLQYPMVMNLIRLKTSIYPNGVAGECKDSSSIGNICMLRQNDYPSGAEQP